MHTGRKELSGWLEEEACAAATEHSSSGEAPNSSTMPAPSLSLLPPPPLAWGPLSSALGGVAAAEPAGGLPLLRCGTGWKEREGEQCV